MKIMAIDYGDAHTGVAISDRTLTLTGFSTVITAYRPEAVIEKLLPLISEHEVSELVLGHPLTNGYHGLSELLYSVFSYIPRFCIFYRQAGFLFFLLSPRS